MNQPPKSHLLYVSHEGWPTFRPDIAALFGKYLPRQGVTSDLVTEQDPAAGAAAPAWGGGDALLCKVPAGRAGQYVAKTWHNMRALALADRLRYDALQVRDMPVTALIGLVAARLKGLPFFYWMSYPQSEGQIARAKARGPKAGMRYWFPLLQGMVGRWLLYRVVLPRADHIFVQSEQMQKDVAAFGIPQARMTPVPMGVDLETAKPEQVAPSDDPRLDGKRAIVYLGTLDRARRIDVLFGMLAIVRRQIPNAVLVLAGDTEDAAHRDWLQQEAVRLGVANGIIWTGWLPTERAWRYVRAGEVGLSTFPRGFLLDSASPTKAVEYMALGVPVVGNDNPDQANAIADSTAGICVPLAPAAFAEAVLALLNDTPRRHAMAAAGRQYAESVRSYARLADRVAVAYRDFFDGYNARMARNRADYAAQTGSKDG